MTQPQPVSLQHFGSDVAGVRARRMLRYVLRSDLVGTQSISKLMQIHVRRAHDDIARAACSCAH